MNIKRFKRIISMNQQNKQNLYVGKNFYSFFQSISIKWKFFVYCMEKSKSILITGSSSGIGEAIALEMSKSKHNFLLTARDADKLSKVAQQVNANGSSSKMNVGDLHDDSFVSHLVEDFISSNEKIDLVIANAGVGRFGKLETLTLEDFDLQFNTNVRSVFALLRLVIPVMRKQNSGQIIIISSVLGVETKANSSLYAASKHAVQAIAKTLRYELEGTNVKVGTINPGAVSTPWFDDSGRDTSKMLTAEDVAKGARLLIDQAETSNIEMLLLRPGKT